MSGITGSDARSEADAWETLFGIVSEIGTGMMASVDEGAIRSRPMQGFVEPETRSVWFFTRASAHKTDEIEARPQVNVAYARPDRQDYASISGRAEIVHDRARIDRFWTTGVAAWFPKGKEDPDLALIRVDVDQAEFWRSPANPVVRLVKEVRANITGQPPSMGENKKL